MLRYITFILFVLVVFPITLSAKPIIFSYYWPVAEAELFNNEITLQSFTQLDINSVTHIDLLPRTVHGNSEVRQFWQQKGKHILNRVYPFRQYDHKTKKYVTLKTYDEIYNNFARNIENSYGISVDELIGSGRSKINKVQREIIIKVLSSIRKNYPDKFISVWGSAKWDYDNIPLLNSINQNCNIFIPEIYLSEKYSLKKDYSIIKKYIQDIERKSHGIINKIIIGIGIYPKLDSEDSILFSNHIINQLNYIFSDLFLSKTEGIAFYAPIYSKNKKLLISIDLIIQNFYFHNKITEQ